MPDLLVLLIPLLPLLACLWLALGYLLGLNRGESGERHTATVSLSAIGLSLLLALWLDVYAITYAMPMHIILGNWLSSGPYLVSLSISTDFLSLLMTTLVTLITFLTTRFSVQYMHREAGFQRFFMVLNLFAAAMLLIVLAGNALLAFIGWELAGVSSYLLIAYAHHRPQVSANANRAFVTNRIGDAGFMLAIYLSFQWFGNSEWQSIAEPNTNIDQLHIILVASCFVLAALVKSAAVPFAPWIARALEGPTPSSAIFYGALMVHAGVYLIIRLQSLLQQTPQVLLILGVIGVLTALYGFFSGLVQSDVKSSLIFSTTAQIGLMLFLCSLGYFGIATWYLVAHASWRAYQFLSAPSLMHMLSRPARPVPHWLQQRHGLYTASLHRFWLDHIADSLFVRPLQLVAREVQNFDEKVINRLVGLPSKSRVLALYQLQDGRRPGYPDVDQHMIGRGEGALGKLMERLAVFFHWFETRLVLRTGKDGLLGFLHHWGEQLQQLDQLLGTPRYLWLMIIITFIVIL